MLCLLVEDGSADCEEYPVVVEVELIETLAVNDAIGEGLSVLLEVEDGFAEKLSNDETLD